MTSLGIVDFRVDLNELKPAEIRVLENSGYLYIIIMY